MLPSLVVRADGDSSRVDAIPGRIVGTERGATADEPARLVFLIAPAASQDDEIIRGSL